MWRRTAPRPSKRYAVLSVFRAHALARFAGKSVPGQGHRLCLVGVLRLHQAGENRSGAGVDREAMQKTTMADIEHKIDKGELAWGSAKDVGDRLIAAPEHRRALGHSSPPSRTRWRALAQNWCPAAVIRATNCALPARHGFLGDPAHEYIEYRRKQQTEQRHTEHAEKYRGTERLPHLGAGAGCKQRNDAHQG